MESSLMEFTKPEVLEARLNIAISTEMQDKLYSIAAARSVSVSLVAREILDDFLQRNFEKYKVENVKSKPKRRYVKRKVR